MNIKRTSFWRHGSAGRQMLCDVHYKADGIPKANILYVHGFNGFKDWGNFDLVAHRFANAGFVFYKFNLSHNGTTLSDPVEFADLEAYSENNYTKELFDVNCMLDHISDPQQALAAESDPSGIILLGHSRGGGICILKAAMDTRVKALLCCASVAACKTPWGNWSGEKIREWEEKGVIFIENKRTGQSMPLKWQLYLDYVQHAEVLDIEKALKSLSIPLQLCHGREDEAVPFSEFLKMKEWAPNASFVEVASDHVFGRKHPWTDPALPSVCSFVVDENIRFLRSAGF